MGKRLIPTENPDAEELMKRYLILFILWFSVVGGIYLFRPAGERCESFGERIDLLTESKSETLMAVVCANRSADVSLQQNTSVCIHFIGRRYSQSETNGGRFLISSGTATRRLISRYRAVCRNTWFFDALEKQSGYYLYRLCRLII